MSSSEKCFICDELLSSFCTREVKEKGLKTLIEYSIKWKDGKHVQLKELQKVTVHEKCRKAYTKKRSSQFFESKQQEKSTTLIRRPEVSFNFQKSCLFCGEDASDVFLKKQRRKPFNEREAVHRVETIELKENIMEASEKRKDDLGKLVSLRLSNVTDLVAAEGRYHSSCIKHFYKPPSEMVRVGRPKCNETSEATVHAYKYLEANREECKFSFQEIFENYDGTLPTDKTIKARLKENFGDDIIISTRQNRNSVVCFRDSGHKILNDAWYERQKQIDEEKEKLRIIETSGKIIAEDTRSKIYETEEYPSPDDFLKEVNSLIPETLKCLIDTIVLKKKIGDTTQWKRKSTAICHSIISACRPKSFLSPLQVGLAVHLNQKYGSKHLLNILSSLGVCASYMESTLFQVSALQHPQQSPLTDSFMQFVFDNADVNIRTLDGFNTFHSMGGIQCVTPSLHNSTTLKPILRLKKIPPASLIGQFGHIPIKYFENKNAQGLTSVSFKDLWEVNPISTNVSISLMELKWLFGKWKGVPDVPGWNGYMEKIAADFCYSTSQIIYLPFTNSPPTDYNTIFTVLNTAVDKCRELHIKTCFVTFDQPLYLKARDIA